MTGPVILKLLQRVRSLRRSEEGSVAILVSVVMVVLLAIAGLSVDVGRTHSERSALQAAADAAALAGARLASASESDRIETALRYFAANYQSPTKGSVTPVASVVGDAVQVNATIVVPMRLAKLAGPKEMRVSVASSAARSSRGVELMFVLDVSGSMGGSGKIEALRTESVKLLETIYGGSETKANTWVGVAPFSGRVNIASYGAGWMTGAPPSGVPDPARLCTGLRSTMNEENDETPGAEPFPYFAGDENTCPGPLAIGLTAEKSTIKLALESLYPGHGASTNKGMAWGWRMLSPKWRGMWGNQSLPLDYDKSPGKVVVFMTDGENHPEQSGDPYTTLEANEQLLRECESMKSEGIEIYTVAFSMGTSLTAIYGECASTPSHHFDADDADALAAAFSNMGDKIVQSELRLIR